MTGKPLTVADYPLAENRPDVVETKAGKRLDDITLEGVLSDHVTLEDLRITGRALRQQAWRPSLSIVARHLDLTP